MGTGCYISIYGSSTAAGRAIWKKRPRPGRNIPSVNCRPIFETLPGWGDDIGSDGLPTAASDYVAFVERALEVEVTLVGTGASRDRVLAL